MSKNMLEYVSRRMDWDVQRSIKSGWSSFQMSGVPCTHNPPTCLLLFRTVDHKYHPHCPPYIVAKKGLVFVLDVAICVRG
mmetsp:Transcript_2836/g.3255  ORF Transcript_2836/g.3255 Transcript_2836/m.3255 type:complete len:80 (-) Transcript_2836:233-472(-)